MRYEWPMLLQGIESVYEITEMMHVSTTKKENKTIQKMLDQIYAAGGVSLYILSCAGIYVSPTLFSDASKRTDVALQQVLTQIREEYKRLALLDIMQKPGVVRVSSSRAEKKVEVPVRDEKSTSVASVNQPAAVVQGGGVCGDRVDQYDVAEMAARCLGQQDLMVRDRAVFDPTAAYRCPLHFSGEIVVMCQCGDRLGDMLNVPFPKVKGCCCPETSAIDGYQYVKRSTHKYSRSYAIIMPHVVDESGMCVTKHPFGPRLVGLRDRLPIVSRECVDLFANCTNYRVTNTILGGKFVSGFHAVLKYAMVLYKIADVSVVPLDSLSGVINNRVYPFMLWAKRGFEQSVSVAKRAFSDVKHRSFVIGHFSDDAIGSVGRIEDKMRGLPRVHFSKSVPDLGLKLCSSCLTNVRRGEFVQHLSNCCAF